MGGIHFRKHMILLLDMHAINAATIDEHAKKVNSVEFKASLQRWSVKHYRLMYLAKLKRLVSLVTRVQAQVYAEDT